MDYTNFESQKRILQKGVYFFFGTVVSLLCLVTLLYAKPEQMELKSSLRKEEEKKNRQMMQSIELTKVADPEARRVLGLLLDSLNIKTNNKNLKSV